jgi:hypothetical protein
MRDTRLWCEAPTALGGKQGNVRHDSAIISGAKKSSHGLDVGLSNSSSLRPSILLHADINTVKAKCFDLHVRLGGI